MQKTLSSYLAALEAVFRNPNDEAARAWWTSEGYAPPSHPVVPLATICGFRHHQPPIPI
jgi:hypothetical protein